MCKREREWEKWWAGGLPWVHLSRVIHLQHHLSNLQLLHQVCWHRKNESRSISEPSRNPSLVLEFWYKCIRRVRQCCNVIGQRWVRSVHCRQRFLSRIVRFGNDVLLLVVLGLNQLCSKKFLPNSSLLARNGERRESGEGERTYLEDQDVFEFHNFDRS